MSVFKCAGCDLHYCVDCDGGTDHCDGCQVGPLCDDCADDHASDHADDEGPSPEEPLPPCVLAMRCYCCAHARGRAADQPCDPNEDASCAHCGGEMPCGEHLDLNVRS